MSLLDTNVLVYDYFQQSPQHAACRVLLDQAQDPDAGLCISPQNLSEFYAIVTNPKRVTHAKTSAEALDLVADLMALSGLSLLPVPVDIVDRWTALIRLCPLTGSKVYDAQIVAPMVGNGVTRIYTYNVVDFQRFDGLTVSSSREYSLPVRQLIGVGPHFSAKRRHRCWASCNCPQRARPSKLGPRCPPSSDCHSLLNNSSQETHPRGMWRLSESCCNLWPSNEL